MTDGAVKGRLEVVIGDLDLTIAEVRSDACDKDTPMHLSSDDSSRRAPDISSLALEPACSGKHGAAASIREATGT